MVIQIECKIIDVDFEIIPYLKDVTPDTENIYIEDVVPTNLIDLMFQNP